MYLVVICPRCGGYSAVKVSVRTHGCPYCGYRMDLDKVGVVSRARNGREAREIIARLKTPRELRRS